MRRRMSELLDGWDSTQEVAAFSTGGDQEKAQGSSSYFLDSADKGKMWQASSSNYPMQMTFNACCTSDTFECACVCTCVRACVNPFQPSLTNSDAVTALHTPRSLNARHRVPATLPVHFFLEKAATGADGVSLAPGHEKHTSINKVGHGLHVADPIFKKYSESAKVLSCLVLM